MASFGKRPQESSEKLGLHRRYGSRLIAVHVVQWAISRRTVPITARRERTIIQGGPARHRDLAADKPYSDKWDGRSADSRPLAIQENSNAVCDRRGISGAHQLIFRLLNGLICLADRMGLVDWSASTRNSTGFLRLAAQAETTAGRSLISTRGNADGRQDKGPRSLLAEAPRPRRRVRYERQQLILISIYGELTGK